MTALARDAVRAQELGAPGVVLAVEGPPVLAPADADRPTQVQTNLLRNAVRAGATRVLVTCAHGDETVSVRVGDDGPGVPDEERERIFDRMVRLDSTRTTGGSGLRLAIARGIARAHGGKRRRTGPAAWGGAASS